MIGESDLYNHNRYEYYCITVESVAVLRLEASFVRSLISTNRLYELVVLFRRFHTARLSFHLLAQLEAEDVDQQSPAGKEWPSGSGRAAGAEPPSSSQELGSLHDGRECGREVSRSW